MSEKDLQTIRALDTKLEKRVVKTLTTCAVIMLIAILIHDGDHIRQAYKWTYSIPLSLWALNLTVYVLPVVSLFLARSRRFSALLVTGIAGIFTSASFLIIHLCGSASGLWGVWNFSYFALIEGVTYNGVFYQGVDTLSWIFLFHVPVMCLPCSYVAFREYARAKKALKTGNA